MGNRTSYLIAGTLAVAGGLWVASGQIDLRDHWAALSAEPGPDQAQGGAQATALPDAAQPAPERNLIRVQVREAVAEVYRREVTLNGRSQANRKVEVKARVGGHIADLPVERGSRVAAEEVLARLAPEDRPARLKEAQARLEQRRIEYEAARRLAEKGYRAEVQLAAAKAALEEARAAVAQAQVAIAHLEITAPFAGVVGETRVELGTLAEPGDEILRLVELDPILLVASVTEREVALLETGAAARARLMDGREIAGTISYVAAEAEANTRTFRIEIRVANSDYTIPDGITAEIVLPLQPLAAHLVPPAALTLDGSGQIGVKAVNAENRVVFYPVQILGNGEGGLWLGGLPERIRLITVGQGFVAVGQEVVPVPAATPAAQHQVTADGNRRT